MHKILIESKKTLSKESIGKTFERKNTVENTFMIKEETEKMFFKYVDF